MVSKVAMVQKVELQNRNQQSKQGLLKRRPQDNFRDLLRAAVQKTVSNS